MASFDDMPDRLALVASAASPDYFEKTIDVGGAPINQPAKRLQLVLAADKFPFARSASFYSPAKWDVVAEFLHGVTSAGVTFEAETDRRHHSLIAEDEKACVVLELADRYENEYTVTVAALTRDDATKWLAAIAELLPGYPPPPPPEPLPYNVIPVQFWMQGPTGVATSRRRNITVTDWADIEDNYSMSVRSELANLAKMDGPSGGKLVLLHGPAGSGKTRMILSMLSQWRSWCTASVVTDTDRFFDDATYLNSILFNSEGYGNWLALVLEDADEYIAVSGRQNKSQSISRLLNMADGIVGQGLNLLTIMTTNVAVDELNPAVVRPGRCLANIEVGAFPVAEANAWLAAKGSTATVEEDSTLATLYATLATR